MKEPQSYGSEKDWVEGEVGEEVNRLKGNPNSQRADFFAEREAQGGVPSPEQIAESIEPVCSTADEQTPVQKVTDRPGGAKTDSYFKKRDYE